MLQYFSNPRLRLFVGAVLISFSPVFVKLVDVSPTTSGFYRALFGGLALAAFILLTGRRFSFGRTAWLALAASAVCFALDLWFWHRSILYIGPGLSTLLANMQVFFMMAAGIVFLRQRPTALQLVAVPLAVVGLTMIVGPDWDALTPAYRLGILLGLLTAISYAGYMLCMRQARMHSAWPVPVREIAVMSLLVAGMLGASAALEGESLAIGSAGDVGWLLAYGILSHAVGMMFIASSLARVSTTETGIALLLQPSLSFLWDILFFARPVTPVEIAGAVIALAAIFMGSTRRLKQP
ncbi:MAG: DMT family transporter [Gammaproteobacteria bacterium]|nr:DMT family transporter [Gammaproteobacteria bacterium]MDH4256531.1 DMT family transporter [Gammaproteobacteria bacterium]MDH5310270.1 DMT family transporter [Gammaproteobacteria bacterium]